MKMYCDRFSIVDRDDGAFIASIEAFDEHAATVKIDNCFTVDEWLRASQLITEAMRKMDLKERQS